MTATQVPVHHLKEGDIIEGVGLVLDTERMASGLVLVVRLDAIDALATLHFQPTWVGGPEGMGWEWPDLPVVTEGNTSMLQ